MNTLQIQHDKELGIYDKERKLKLNKFIEEFNDKESNQLLKSKMKKLKEERNKIQIKIQAHLEKQMIKKNTELTKMENDENNKRIAFLQKMRDEEKKDLLKRRKKNTDELSKLREYINNKPPTEKYLYQKKIQKFSEDENNLIIKENNKRKQFMKHIDLNEFNEMKKNLDENKYKQIMDSNEKTKVLKESWAQRQKLIPLYVSPLSKITIEEEYKTKEEEQNKILRSIELKNIQKNYSKNVPKPLKIVRQKIEDETHQKKTHVIKSNSYSDLLRQKMIKNYNKKNKQKSCELISNNNINNNLTTKGENKQKLSQKILQNNLSSQNSKNRNLEKKTQIDYLKEFRRINQEKKEQKIKSGKYQNLIEYTGTNDIKNLIKNNGINNNTLKVANSRLESLEEKKKRKNLLLKCSGGVANKPELGEELCDLMIDSIQAKLSLIKEIDKNLEKHEEKKEEKKENDLIEENANSEEDSELNEND